VLDLAAGTGLMTRALAERGCEVTMLDLLPEMCGLARHALPPGSAARVRIMCGDACEFRDFDPGTFNAVVCTQALNFVREPGLLFETAALALQPGGVFYFDIDTAFRWTVIESLSGRVENARAIAEDGVDIGKCVVGADYYFYTRDWLEKELRSAGFHIESVFGLLFAAPLLHLFNQSSDFLEPETLHPSARQFLKPEKLDQLMKLEQILMKKWPPEMAGYHAFVARKAAI